MNIWILTSETPHHWAGGIARYVDNFARVFSGQTGHRVTVISRGEKDGEREVVPGYRLVEFKHRYEASKTPGLSPEPDDHPGWPYNNMAYFAALSYQYLEEVGKLIVREGVPDLIECQDYAAIGYFLLQKKLTHPDFLRDTPVLLHLHTPDFAVQSYNQYPRYKLPDYWIGRMERACIWMADTVLSPSRFIAEEIGQWLDGPPPAITTIPYPVPELGQTIAGAQGIEKRLLCPGRLELRKGVEPLLKTCDELWRDGADFVLDMIGGDVHTPLKGGSLETYLKNRYHKWVEGGRLVFHGALSHADCMKHMGAATAVVVPSLWENFPNTCIEAMALGKVVVASRQGGQAEMVGDDGSAGVLFSHEAPGTLKSAIMEALSLSPEERDRMGKIARGRIESLCDPATVVEQRLEHFRQVISTYQRKPLYPFSNECFRESSSAPALPDSPLVSVVVPFFNLGAFVKECIDSIYTSEEVRFEVIIVNDGSDDPQSLAILEEIRNSGRNNLRVLDIPNGGLANARNVGAETAHGELIAFVDADDMILPRFLSRSVELLKRYPNVHLVYSWVRYFDGGNGFWFSWTFDLPYLLCHNQLVPIAVIRRESFLKHGRNKSHIVYGLEDYESWISLAEAGCGGVGIPEELVRYRIRRDSMFRAIQPDKKLYLYDLISAEHPELYRDYGLELFNLQNANGPAYGWDQPTMFRAPQERLLVQLEYLRDSLRKLEIENKRLSEAEQWHHGEIKRLQAEHNCATEQG